MKNRNRDRLTEKGETQNSIWEGPTGICWTQKQGLQELEGQPEPPPAGQHSVPASPRDGVTKFVKDGISMPGSFSLYFSLC